MDKKNIVFLMYTSIIGQGLEREFLKQKEYETVLTNDYENTELYLNKKTPDIILIEVADHSSYPIGYCMQVSDRFKKKYPQCKSMLFLNHTPMEEIIEEVIKAKKENRIDGFTTSFTRLEEIVAGLKALK